MRLCFNNNSFDPRRLPHHCSQRSLDVVLCCNHPAGINLHSRALRQWHLLCDANVGDSGPLQAAAPSSRTRRNPPGYLSCRRAAIGVQFDAGSESHAHERSFLRRRRVQSLDRIRNILFVATRGLNSTPLTLSPLPLPPPSTPLLLTPMAFCNQHDHFQRQPCCLKPRPQRCPAFTVEVFASYIQHVPVLGSHRIYHVSINEACLANDSQCFDAANKEPRINLRQLVPHGSMLQLRTRQDRWCMPGCLPLSNF